MDKGSGRQTRLISGVMVTTLANRSREISMRLLQCSEWLMGCSGRLPECCYGVLSGCVTVGHAGEVSRVLLKILTKTLKVHRI